MHTSPRTISSDPINPVKTTEVATKSPNQEWLNRQGIFLLCSINIRLVNKIGNKTYLFR